jgi:subtilisin family serine protease
MQASRETSTGRLMQSVTDVQLSMIGLDQMHSDGFHGEGVLIAVMDSGFPGVNSVSHFQHLFDEERIDLTTSYNFSNNLNNVFGYDPDGHGTLVLSVMAAYLPESYVGGAYQANYILFVTEEVDTEYRVEEFNWLFAAERADSAGVDIINTSLGYNIFDDDTTNYAKSELDGETAIVTQAANIAVSKGIIVAVAAGNEGNNGWGIVTAPADAQDILAVGAVNSLGSKSSISSEGPTADDRIKPDVSALGVSVSVVQQNGVVGTRNGTSVSTPLVSSLAAGVWQILPNLTAKQVVDTIKHTASRASSPNNLIGYGVPSYYSIFKLTSAEDRKEPPTMIYPNPASKVVTAELKIGKGRITDVALFTMSGEVVQVPYEIEADNKVRLHVSGIASGPHILKLVTDQGVESHKLFKIE